jgi:hypothetical protein
MHSATSLSTSMARVGQAMRFSSHYTLFNSYLLIISSLSLHGCFDQVIDGLKRLDEILGAEIAV